MGFVSSFVLETFGWVVPWLEVRLCHFNPCVSHRSKRKKNLWVLGPVTWDSYSSSKGVSLERGWNGPKWGICSGIVIWFFYSNGKRRVKLCWGKQLCGRWGVICFLLSAEDTPLQLVRVRRKRKERWSLSWVVGSSRFAFPMPNSQC